jgi:hypothetical protein
MIRIVDIELTPGCGEQIAWLAVDPHTLLAGTLHRVPVFRAPGGSIRLGLPMVHGEHGALWSALDFNTPCVLADFVEEVHRALRQGVPDLYHDAEALR